MKILNVNCRLLAVLLLLVLEACTDYASKMEDDFEEWKAAQSQSSEGEVVVSSSSITPKSRSSETIVSSSSPVPVVDPSTVVMGEMTDARDGQTYKIVTIGSQTWMAENLNYETENSYCYNDSVKYCAKYGRLYEWHIAATVCPSGWHLPDTTEWNTLFAAVGGQSTAGKMLKSTSANGTNAYAFSALPAGYRNYSGGYNYKDSAAYFWGSTKYDNLNANCAYLLYDYDNAHHHYQYYTPYSMNVRCVKDENSSSITPQSSSSRTRVSSSSVKSSSSAPSSSSEIKLETLTDERDGQTYKIVTIGSQTWMAENLNYETDNSYCYNDSPSNCTKYGRLYTWNAAKMACPSGWHLPALAEFDTLYVAVGGKSSAGAALKSASGWIVDDECKDSEKCVSDYEDAYLFTVLPAGVRRNGTYGGEGGDARFWTSSEYSGDDAFLTYMGSYYNEANDYYDSKDAGYSVRCVKGESLSGDTPQSSSSATSVSSNSVPEGYVDPSTVVTGSVTDERDGQTYKTVTIGTQTWMAENLNYAYTGVPYSVTLDEILLTSDSTSWYVNNNSPDCTKCGRLYTWAAAMDSVGTWSTNGRGCGYGKACSPTYPVRGVCPEGWHLPTSAEFEALLAAVGGQSTAGKMLKSASGWYECIERNPNGTDAYAFSAFSAGYRSEYGSYDGVGFGAYFWSSSVEGDNYSAYDMDLSCEGDEAALDFHTKSGFYKYHGLSVRCVKD